jgi:hypothetical protein
MDAEAGCSFGSHQHTAIAKPVVARAKRISMDEVGDAQRGKAGSVAIGRFAILCSDGEELESDEADVESIGGEGLEALALSSGCNSAVCALV